MAWWCVMLDMERTSVDTQMHQRSPAQLSLEGKHEISVSSFDSKPGAQRWFAWGRMDGYHKYQPTSHSPVIPYSAYRQIGITWHNQQWDPGAIHSQHGSRRSQNPSVWLDCFPAVARHWRSLPNLGGRDDLGEPPVLIWWETNGKMTTAYNGINYLQQFK